MKRPDRRRRAICVTSVLTAALLGAPGSALARPAAGARGHGLAARPHEIVLEVRGSAEEATALRTTLQELTARRGLPCVFATPDDRASLGFPAPWATLSFELDRGEAKSRSADEQGDALGPALTLREGASGRLRLHRVLPRGASPAVMIETLATIAYTALETLAREETTRPLERPAATPRERAEPAPVRERAEHAPPEPEAAPGTAPEPPPAATPEGAALSTTAETLPVIVSPRPDPPRPPETDGDALTVAVRAPAHAAGVTSTPFRLSLASFTGYRTGNALTGDRRTEGAWGMGIATVGALPRWPLEPALGVGFGAWYGTGHDPFGSGAVNDGGPRPAAGPQMQGQAELRLTLLRHGRFSGALGPWLNVSRATYDFGPPPLGPRASGPNQGPPPNQGPAPNTTGDGGSRVTHTEVSAGLAARVEAELGGRLSLYLALVGTTPLTNRPVANDGRPGPNGSGQSSPDATTPRWTATAFAGLSIALISERAAF